MLDIILFMFMPGNMALHDRYKIEADGAYGKM